MATGSATCSSTLFKVTTSKVPSIATSGLAFYTGDAFPAEYRDNLFVAYHGSWNRSVPTGYKVVRIRFDASGKPLAPEDFATGFVNAAENKVKGRPVGVTTGRFQVFGRIRPDAERFLAHVSPPLQELA